jgi:hypothetical protein
VLGALRPKDGVRGATLKRIAPRGAFAALRSTRTLSGGANGAYRLQNVVEMDGHQGIRLKPSDDGTHIIVEKVNEQGD